MTSVLILEADTRPGATLESDLVAAGIHVLGATARNTLVRDSARLAPDAVIVRDDEPDQGLFEAVETLGRVAPCAVVLFTEHADSERIAQGIRAGIHAYVVRGYGAQRLRPLIQSARARFVAEHAMRKELAETTARLEERTLVERAKGILMKSGSLAEDEAFRILRSASQRDRKRLGQVARRLIEAARAAEAVNRAGQLRMLSQRIVKLQALRLAGVETDGAAALLEQSCWRARANFEALQALLAGASVGEMMEQARRTWSDIDAALRAPGGAHWLAQLDGLAELLLVQAERLLQALGSFAPRNTLQAINICGRQRMLSQRAAKQALLSGLIEGPVAQSQGAAATAAEFERGLQWLRENIAEPGMNEELEGAAACWERLRDSLPPAARGEARLALAAASEELLDMFERLTDRFERSLPVLLGSPDAP